MRKLLIATIILTLSFTGSLYAAGGVAVFPNRIEIKDGKNNSEIRLINKGQEDVTYRVSLQNLRMDENGIYKEITESEKEPLERFATTFIRYSPKRITVKANQVQTVRIMVDTKSLDDGEYRSHILFREESPSSLGVENNIENIKDKNKKISVVLKPLFGVSVPIIIQKGVLEAKVQFSDILQKDEQIAFSLNRQGDKSEYGDVKAYVKISGKEIKVGELNGASLLYPYPKRNFVLNLESTADIAGKKISELDIYLKFFSKDGSKLLAEGLLKR